MLSRGGIVGACTTGLLLGALAGGCVLVVDWNGDESGERIVGSRRSAPKLGVYTAEPGSTLAAQLNIDRRHATVLTGVVPGSPADRAGLKKYDVITAIDGEDDADPRDLRRAVGSKDHGDVISLRVIRAGTPMDVDVRLDRPAGREVPPY